MEDDLGAELGEQRLADVFGVEVGGGIADQSNDVRSIGAVGACVEPVTGEACGLRGEQQVTVGGEV